MLDANLLCYVLFSGYGDHRYLHVLTHSFPTRRSSDLGDLAGQRAVRCGLERVQVGEAHHFALDRAARAAAQRGEHQRLRVLAEHLGAFAAALPLRESDRLGPDLVVARSEEHTSELQSLMRTSYAVFCLKTKTKNSKSTTQSE